GLKAQNFLSALRQALSYFTARYRTAPRGAGYSIHTKKRHRSAPRGTIFETFHLKHVVQQLSKLDNENLSRLQATFFLLIHYVGDDESSYLST
uniref:Uncharacterized protein n=1 Tax=Romanomermis culicivorax TaxID=13658 RepID=A0A915HHQ3_ROMCU